MPPALHIYGQFVRDYISGGGGGGGGGVDIAVVMVGDLASGPARAGAERDWTEGGRKG